MHCINTSCSPQWLYDTNFKTALRSYMIQTSRQPYVDSQTYEKYLSRLNYHPHHKQIHLQDQTDAKT